MATKTKKKTRQNQGSTSRRWNQLLYNTWTIEIAALIFSASCLVAIMIVLGVYDGSADPRLPYGLTLNAIISILAIGSKSALIFAIAAALGQLKWVWFRQSRNLQHIQLFDDASRGPWGSVALLKHLNIRTLASLGAFVTILALAFEPFVQQILQYPVIAKSQPNQDTSVRMRSVFNVDSLLGSQFGYADDTASYTRALNVGLYSYENDFEQKPSCPTGNCNWPMYRSIALCTRCTDAKSYVSMSACDVEAYRKGKSNSLNCEVSFGHGNPTKVAYGHTLNDSDARTYNYRQFAVWSVSQVSIYDHARLNNTDRLSMSRIPAFQDIPQPGLVLGQASVDWGAGIADEQPVITMAEECVITHCAIDYNLTVAGGRAKFEKTRTLYGSYKEERVTEVSPMLGYDYGPPGWSHICWQAEPGYVTYEKE